MFLSHTHFGVQRRSKDLIITHKLTLRVLLRPFFQQNTLWVTWTRRNVGCVNIAGDAGSLISGAFPPGGVRPPDASTGASCAGHEIKRAHPATVSREMRKPLCQNTECAARAQVSLNKTMKHTQIQTQIALNFAECYFESVRFWLKSCILK